MNWKCDCQEFEICLVCWAKHAAYGAFGLTSKVEQLLRIFIAHELGELTDKEFLEQIRCLGSQQLLR
jgi:hypothetical protein